MLYMIYWHISFFWFKLGCKILTNVCFIHYMYNFKVVFGTYFESKYNEFTDYIFQKWSGSIFINTITIFNKLHQIILF